MHASLELAVRAVAIGVGATLVMDLWAALLRQFGVPSLNMAHLGRWIGHLVRSPWQLHSIAATPPVRGEWWIGWCAHYAIGVTFSVLLLSVKGLGWAQSPSLFPPVLTGLVTVAAPLLILQPGMGAGVASRHTARPVFNSLKSVLTHLVFGIGMYGAAVATAWLWPAHG